MHEPEILDGAGEDELVDEQDDGLGGQLGRRPFDLVELVEPVLQVLKELLFQFGLLGGVLEAAHGIQHAAGFAAAGEEIRERQFGKGLVLEEEVAGAEEPRGAEVGEDEVFVVAEVFLDLGDVVFGIGVVAPKRVRAVALEERFEFERDGFARLRSGSMKSTQPSLVTTWRVGGNPSTSLHSAVNKSSAADSGLAPFFRSRTYFSIGA